MVFTIKKPSSKRYSQLSFEGFRPQGRTRAVQLVNLWVLFSKSLFSYLIHLVKKVLVFIYHLFTSLMGIPSRLKGYIIKKLIWSRGRLGRPLATLVVVTVSFGVFLLGEVFSGSDLVVSSSTGVDYIVTPTDIIPKKEIALTTVPDIRKRSEPFLYIVEAGDSLYSIGSKFKISTDALKYVNNLNDYSVLRIGQEVTIPPSSGLIHKIASGDTLNSIASKYSVSAQAIADFNYLLDTSKLAVNTELVIPGAKVPVTIIIPSVINPGAGTGGNATANKNLCVWPSTVRIVTQDFSWYHNGIDIATPHNMGMPPLLACTDGTVTRAGWDPFGLGLHVRIVHAGGYETIYGHMSRLDVSYGDSVSKGEVIGLMGNTGRSTGPHIHFMVKYNGVAQDPANFMQ